MYCILYISENEVKDFGLISKKTLFALFVLHTLCSFLHYAVNGLITYVCFLFLTLVVSQDHISHSTS